MPLKCNMQAENSPGPKRTFHLPTNDLQGGAVSFRVESNLICYVMILNISKIQDPTHRMKPKIFKLLRSNQREISILKGFL